MHLGCFVWTPTPPLAGRRTPRPGPARVCVCLLFSAGAGGLASRARSGAPHLFFWPLWLSALLGRSVPCVFSFLSAPPLSLAFFGFRPRVLWALALCFAFSLSLPPLGSPCALAFFFLCLTVGCSLVLGAPPPLPLCLAGFVPAARCPPFFVFFSLRAPPLSLAFSGFRPRVPWALALCFVCFVGLLLPGSPCALSFFCVSPGRWLLPGGCCAPPPPAAWCSFLFFFFFVVRPRSLRLSLVSGPGCLGPRRCALFALLASRFSALCAFSPLSCLPSGRWLLPGGCCPPFPPFCVSRFSSLPLGAVCRVLCCAVCLGLRCCAALLRVMLPGVVLLCAVLFCCARLVPLLVVPCSVVLPVALGPCALRRSVLRGSPALCVFCLCVVVCAVVRRSALCCVCPRVLCCAFPVLSAPYGAVLRCAGALALCCSCGACCCWRPVLWCPAVCCAVSFGVLWCGAGSGGPWLSADAVLWRPALCFPSVRLCLFPVCAVLCCAARRVVRIRLRLRCCWCLLPWRVPVCCGVSLGVLRCGGAALVCRGVLLCCALSCGVLRPVLCPAVMCCLAVLCWWPLLCGCLRC